MNFKDSFLYKKESKNIYDNNIYISFTTIPSRLVSDKFKQFLTNITKYHFKLLCFISEYEDYDIDDSKITKEKYLNKIYEYKNKYKINFIYTKNLGSINKIIPISKLKLNDNDIIIIIDDDMLYDNIDYHVIGHDIYMCDCIGINEKTLIKKWNDHSEYVFNQSNILFQNNYNGYYYGWLSYSCRFYVLKYIEDFYYKILKLYPNIKYHDDFVVSLYFYFIKSNSIELKINTIKSKNSELFKNKPSLKNKIDRKKLETKIIQELNIDFSKKDYTQRNYISKKLYYDFIYQNNKDNIISYENNTITFYKYDKIIMTIGNINFLVNVKYFDKTIKFENLKSNKISIIVPDHKFISRNKTIKNKNLNKLDEIDYSVCSKYQNNFIHINNHIQEIKINNFDFCITDKINNFNYSNYSNFCISLTTIPSRLLSDSFETIIKNYSQFNTKIYIHYCKKYNRNIYNDHKLISDRIEYLESNYQNVKFNSVNDYGPLTKILGITKIKIPKEIEYVIIVDDDQIMDKNILFYYKLCYELYQCDGIGIDERNVLKYDKIWNEKDIGFKFKNNKNIFYDNYHNFFYGWLSYSFKINNLTKLEEFYEKYISEYGDESMYHDDLIITMYSRKMKFYLCGINLFFNNKESRLDIDNLDNLRNDKWDFRNNLEEKVLNNNNINFTKYDGHNYIIDDIDIQFNINEINYRDMIDKFSQNEIKFSNKNCPNIFGDIKSINNILFLTITSYLSDTNNNKIIFEYNLNEYEIYFDGHYKQTIQLETNTHIKNISFNNSNIFQTTNNMYLNKYYSITSILCKYPYSYKLFYDCDQRKYIEDNFKNVLYVYDLLNVKTYKSDLMRALKLYREGGFYFDCKLTMKNYINHETIFVKDLFGYTYNGMIKLHKNNHLFGEYITIMIMNILRLDYCKNHLDITGPSLLSNYNFDTQLKNKSIDNNWKNNILVDNDDNEIIKINFPEYYEKTSTKHYSDHYKERSVFNENIVRNNSHIFLNNFDIFYINLERSSERKNKMEKLLHNYKYKRIEGIDGVNINNDYVKACLLSHLKVHKYIFDNFNDDNKLFLILEDDVHFNYMNYLTEDQLKLETNKILSKMNECDIMLIAKTFNNKLDEFTNWNEYYNNGNHIASTAGYIIRLSGIKKILQFKRKFDLADKYIYKFCNTLVYKYNLIDTDNKDSLIHLDHVDWHKKCSLFQEKEIVNNFIFQI
jgi:hypothetical protein